MGPEAATTRINTRFQQTVKATDGFHSAAFLVHSDSRNIHVNLAAGQNGQNPASPEQPFYAASIGKTFTATIMAMLVEKDEVRFDDPITPYLSEGVVENLHVYHGTDYTNEIRIHHLLNHSSGLPHLLSDEFGLFKRRNEESPEGKTFFDVVIEDPDRFWGPEETIEWAKAHLHSHFPPGNGIYYSEVGYNLLGLIIEHVTGGAFHEALHDFLFDPLAMNHSYHSQFSEPAIQPDLPVSPIHVDGRTFDIERYRSFSGWYAGGQTVNTAEDLLKFHRALVDGRLVEAETFEEMTRWRRLTFGLDYGYGVIRFRPLPLLSRYYSWGGLGSTNAFMLYNPGNDVYLIGTFNQTASRGKAMRFAFRALRTVSNVELAT